VAGWIPPGATVADSGVDPITDQYTLGGTGSWWMESIGNTWGWDNGNWPQVDALVHFFLPFQWTEGLTESIQSVAQSAFIDGSGVNCEFECSNVLGYLGGWLTNLGNVFSSTYPTPKRTPSRLMARPALLSRTAWSMSARTDRKPLQGWHYVAASRTTAGISVDQWSEGLPRPQHIGSTKRKRGGGRQHSYGSKR
jgi:hypothetical protein